MAFGLADIRQLRDQAKADSNKQADSNKPTDGADGGRPAATPPGVPKSPAAATPSRSKRNLNSRS
eukprot:3503620-Prymnesium_polylepis.1